MSKTNVAIVRNKKENSISTIKRFTRRMQESGVLKKVRSIRYLQREESPYTRKKGRLHSIRRKEEILEQIKLGKMPEKQQRRRR